MCDLNVRAQPPGTPSSFPILLFSHFLAAGKATARYRKAVRDLWHRVSFALWRGNGRMLAGLLEKLRSSPVSEEAAAQIKKDAAAAAAAAALASAVLAAAGGVVELEDDGDGEVVGGDAGDVEVGAIMMGGAAEAPAVAAA